MGGRRRRWWWWCMRCRINNRKRLLGSRGDKRDICIWSNNSINHLVLNITITKSSTIKGKKINMYKLIPSMSMQIRRKGVKWNVFKKDNVTRNIHFIFGRIITMITLLAVLITKKDTYCKTRRQFSMFYLWKKNKASGTKDFYVRITKSTTI